MKRFFRYISLLLVAVMLLTVPAFAAEQRASSYIMSTCVYLNPTTGTQFRVWHEVIALGIMDELGACEIKVQESTNGVSWTTVKTYTPADTPNMVAQDTAGYAACVTYTGIAGRYYRARIVQFAENSSGRGEVIDYTDPIRVVSLETA